MFWEGGGARWGACGVRCERCAKWRCLPSGAPPPNGSDLWVCAMNPDLSHSSCDAPEEDAEWDGEWEGQWDPNEDYEDGEADPRQTSRAQRCVFEANLDQVADTDKAFYMTLGQKDCVHPGKMKERAKIVNAHVSRDASYTSKITPKERTLEQITARTVEKNNEQQKQGLTKNVMIGSKFGASKELFQAALDDNEIWEEDGLYYSTSKTFTMTDKMSKTALGQSTWEGGDDKEFMSALADMMESSKNLKNLWLEDVQKNSTTKQPMMADKDNSGTIPTAELGNVKAFKMFSR